MTRTRLLPGRRARSPSATERTVGAALLLLLAGTVTLFAVSGRRPGPPGLPAPPARGAGARAGALPLTSPAGWPRGEVESYDAEGLYEKIDGKADAYLAYDVVGLTFASYANPTDPSVYADVYLYDMGDPLHAFGIYRSERSGAETPLAGPGEGCATGGAAFFRTGSRYVEVVGSGPAAYAETRALARAVAASLPAGEARVAEPPWFPAEGRTRLTWVLRDCLGIAALGNAFVAEYADGTKLLVAEYPTPEEAREAGRKAGEELDFLGTPASFAVVGSRLAGVVGETGGARLEALRRSLGEER